MTYSYKQNLKIIEQAAHWATCLDDAPLSQTERKELALWLQKSPQHVKELLLAQAISTDANAIDPNKNISIDMLLEGQRADVISLIKEQRPVNPSFSAPQQNGSLVKQIASPAISIAASFFAVIAITLVFLVSPFNDEGAIYTTNIGEQRSLSLADGSVVHLNTHSKIQVQYDDKVRNIVLLKGEALFDVVHNPQKPFRVHANSTVTEALGTSFNVYLKDAGIEVAVTEGKVSVKTNTNVSQANLSQNTELPAHSTSTAPKSQTTLEQGQKALIDQSGFVTKSHDINIQNIVAWRQRKLVFENTPIAEIISEFNRYNIIQIHIEKTDNIEPRFSGVFSADNLKAFLATLKVSGATVLPPNEANIVIIRFTSQKGTFEQQNKLHT